jgi:5-hydroxyisourate hydrolase
MGVSTHILDTASGRPAAGVGITLEVHRCGAWVGLMMTQTDSDGRGKQLLPEGEALEAAVYRLRFDTAGYYAVQQMEGLYPLVEITFMVTDAAQHYHIPLLLTANGYTTYRGS